MERAEQPNGVRGDVTRQVTVVLAEVFCVLGTLVGVGVLGTRVEESSGGALAADATRLAPAGPAFSIWSVIYAGLAAYAIWQALPRHAADARQRAIGWLAAASMVLNATWLLVTQQGWIWVSVLVILALVGTLGVIVRRLSDRPAASLAERIVVDTTFGLYLGWVAVATCANITAALVDSGVEPADAVADAVAVAVIGVAVGVVWLVQRTTGPQWAVALAASWGLAWIAVGRIADEPRTLVVGVAAALAAALTVALSALAARPAQGTVAGNAAGNAAGAGRGSVPGSARVR